MPRSSPPPESTFLRDLRRALVTDVQADILLALKVGVLLAVPVSRTEIARRLGETPADLRRAYDRLERVAPNLDRDSDLG